MDVLLGNLVLLALDVPAARLSRRGPWGIVGAAALGVVGAIGFWQVSRLLTWTSMFLVLQLWCWWGLVHLPVVWLVVGWRRGRRGAALLYAGAATAFGVQAFVREPHDLEVTTTALPGPSLRVALVADLQTDRVGPFEAEVFARIREAEPDLVLFAGDYIQVRENDRFVEEAEALRALVATLDPPLGGYAVRGDVEATAWATIFAGTPITAVDETRTFRVGPLTLSTLSIQDSRRDDVVLPVVEGLHVVLGHAPDFVLGSARRDLNLAGHTHGGQVQIPGLGPILTLSRVPRAAAAGGLTVLEDGRHLYVSRGIGMERLQAPRLRFNCRPELALLDLGAAPVAAAGPVPAARADGAAPAAVAAAPLVAPTPVVPLAAAPLAAAAAPTAAGPPGYGFWGLNGFVSAEGFAELKRRVGLTVFQVANEDPAWTVGTLLPEVRAAGLRVTLRLTGDHPYYTEAGGFNLAAWKARLVRWRGAGLEPFIADGTLVGHMLLDDVVNFETYDPTAADFEEMARASKALFPELPTFVRQQATALPVPAGGRYRWLDAQVNQYEVKEGPVEVYAARESARARELGLVVVNGLNVADGGDGSSGQPGYRARHWAMSAEEIRRYGAVLAAVPGCAMFLNWEYDGQERWHDGTIGADWLQRPDVEAALRALGEQVRARPSVGLLRPPPTSP